MCELVATDTRHDMRSQVHHTPVYMHEQEKPDIFRSAKLNLGSSALAAPRTDEEDYCMMMYSTYCRAHKCRTEISCTARRSGGSKIFETNKRKNNNGRDAKNNTCIGRQWRHAKWCELYLTVFSLFTTLLVLSHKARLCRFSLHMASNKQTKKCCRKLSSTYAWCLRTPVIAIIIQQQKNGKEKKPRVCTCDDVQHWQQQLS